jgi:hypothetical protein
VRLAEVLLYDGCATGTAFWHFCQIMQNTKSITSVFSEEGGGWSPTEIVFRIGCVFIYLRTSFGELYANCTMPEIVRC